jgi:hypothetical protein
MKLESISDVTGGWLRLLVVLLHLSRDVGGKDGLQPRGWTTANDPSVRGGYRASKAGGELRGSKGKAFVPGHAWIIARKIKCAMRKIILARLYALRIVRVSTNHTMTRNQIAARIIKSRNENTFAEFVAQHPTTTGIGTWRYSCDRAGWHSFTVCKAMETFGKSENLAWRVAGKNATVTLEELLVDAAESKDADASAEIVSKISNEERKNPGTICSVVKAACEKAGVFFNRTSHEKWRNARECRNTVSNGGQFLWRTRDSHKFLWPNRIRPQITID